MSKANPEINITMTRAQAEAAIVACNEYMGLPGKPWRQCSQTLALIAIDEALRIHTSNADRAGGRLAA